MNLFKPVRKVNIKSTFSFTFAHQRFMKLALYSISSIKNWNLRDHTGRNVVRYSRSRNDRGHSSCSTTEGEVKITPENISNWFDSNYASLIKTEHSYLAEPQRNAALKQVLRYAERQSGKWDVIKQAEVDVSLVQPDYIIEGKIDLVKGAGDTVELVDFKSEKKPDLIEMRDRLEHYRRQLHIYAFLIEQRTGQKVSKMNIYYTGEENGNPMITFPYTKSAIEGTVAAFDDTVHKILRKDFKHICSDPKTCANCDFRFYCSNR